MQEGREKWGRGGGGQHFLDYVSLVVPYTSRGVWGHAPQKYFCAMRQLLVQSKANMLFHRYR